MSVTGWPCLAVNFLRQYLVEATFGSVRESVFVFQDNVFVEFKTNNQGVLCFFSETLWISVFCFAQIWLQRLDAVRR